MKINNVPQSVWQNPWEFVAFGFGSGAMPIMPGTFGTFAAIPFYLMTLNCSLLSYSIVLIIAIIFGIWLCDRAEKAVRVPDHPGIVWDEFVGFWLTMLAVPHCWYWIVVGFILFRIFDIWKPQPIRWLNKNVKGGFGIIIDDLAAAVPAWIILQFLVWVFQGNGVF